MCVYYLYSLTQKNYESIKKFLTCEIRCSCGSAYFFRIIITIIIFEYYKSWKYINTYTLQLPCLLNFKKINKYNNKSTKNEIVVIRFMLLSGDDGMSSFIEGNIVRGSVTAFICVFIYCYRFCYQITQPKLAFTTVQWSSQLNACANTILNTLYVTWAQYFSFSNERNYLEIFWVDNLFMRMCRSKM